MLKRTAPRRRARSGILLSGLFAVTACSMEKGPQPAPYVAQEPGTVYHYEGITNTITGVEGWRTAFTDSHGRPGSRLALFIPESPLEPARVDSAQLAALWPLEVGKEAVVTVQRGPEQWRWEFRVAGTQQVDVSAGSFETYVVQAVETPELVRDPEQAYSATYTWWYAPEVSTVVKFRTTYLSGPPAGRTFESQLERIESPAE